jgi:hypothetical protein
MLIVKRYAFYIRSARWKLQPSCNHYVSTHNNEFSYNSPVCNVGKLSVILLEIPLRTNVEGKIRLPQ